MAVEVADRLELLYRETGSIPEQKACAKMLYYRTDCGSPPFPFDALGFGTRSTWLQRAADHLNES